MADFQAATLTFICCSLLCDGVALLDCSMSHDDFHDELEKKLQAQKIHRPVKRFSDVLNVSIDITVVGLLGVNEKHQSLTVYIWQVLEWKIYGLGWNAKECGFSRISLPRETFWVPDIHIKEFMEEDKTPPTPFVYLYSTGRVFDDKPIRVVSSCKLGIYSFPFDTQNCTLTFGSYIYFSDQLMLSAATTAAEILEESLQVSQTQIEWELVYIQLTQQNEQIGGGNYAYIIYSLILKRRPILYVVNLILPSVFLVTLDVFSFFLPPQELDRSALKMTIILGYTVFLLLMSEMLPVAGKDVPILNVFFSLSFAMMVASLLVTLFIVHVHFHSRHFSVPPHWLSVLMLRYVAAAMCLPERKRPDRVTVSLPERGEAVTASIVFPRELRNTSGDPPDPANPVHAEVKRANNELTAICGHLDKRFKESRSSQEWKKIALVMDRLAFYLYLLVCIVSLIAIITIWHGSMKNIPKPK